MTNNRLIFLLSVLLNIFLIILIAFKKRSALRDFFLQNYSIVMFGDSLTANARWHKLLKRSDVKTSGNWGGSTSYFIFLLDKQVIAFNPRTCYLQGGINDLVFGIPLSRICSNYQSIIERLQQQGIAPVVQSTLYTTRNAGINKEISGLNSFLKGLCLAKHIPFVDLNEILSKNGFLLEEYAADGNGIHLNAAGYKIWADRLLMDMK